MKVMLSPHSSAKSARPILNRRGVRRVSASRIGGDQQAVGAGVVEAPLDLPPAAQGLYREGSGVAVGAHVHPAAVAAQVVDAVRSVRAEEVVIERRSRAGRAGRTSARRDSTRSAGCTATTPGAGIPGSVSDLRSPSRTPSNQHHLPWPEPHRRVQDPGSRPVLKRLTSVYEPGVRARSCRRDRTPSCQCSQNGCEAIPTTCGSRSIKIRWSRSSHDS